MFGPLGAMTKKQNEKKEKEKCDAEMTKNSHHGHRHLLHRQRSMADFQDGKRFSAKENTSLMEGSQTLRSLHASSRRLLFHHLNGDCSDSDDDIDTVRQAAVHPSLIQPNKHTYFGLYRNYPLAESILEGTPKREAALRKSGEKQMNHPRGSDGWWLSMLVLECRAIDNYSSPWIFICLNAIFACILSEVFNIRMPEEELQHWDTMFTMVLKSSLAFLLVFRLNRCSIRFWEARTFWGNVTHSTRNLVGTIIMYSDYSNDTQEKKFYRDCAIRWGTSFCVAAKHFIRSQHVYPDDEFAGFLTSDEVSKLRDSNHSPLLAASMCRYYLNKLFHVDDDTPPGLAYAYSIRLSECENFVSSLVEQVSGMEKIRSTPLAIAYVTHLRTFLFAYCLLLPYVWVSEWSWSTIPLIAFTFFALAGIEGVSQEVEIPFRPERPNHLAIDAYCLVMMDSVLGLVVQDANRRINDKSLDFAAKDDSDSDSDNECHSELMQKYRRIANTTTTTSRRDSGSFGGSGSSRRGFGRKPLSRRPSRHVDTNNYNSCDRNAATVSTTAKTVAEYDSSAYSSSSFDTIKDNDDHKDHNDDEHEENISNNIDKKTTIKEDNSSMKITDDDDINNNIV